MKNFKIKLISFLLLLVFFSLLNSCSYQTHFFILNKSKQDLDISIEFIFPIKKTTNDSFKYTDKVLKINNKTLEKLDKNLEYKIIDNNIIQLTIPKNSTILISRQINQKPKINSILISDVSYSKEEFEKKIRKGGGFHNYYYSIIQ